VGTSVSNRSPNTPKWQAAVAAYARGLPEERASVELINAARDWLPSLTSEAIGAYVDAVADAWETFPEQVQGTGRGDAAISWLVDAATRKALGSADDASAVAFAERAFRRILVQRSQSDVAVAESTPDQIIRAWEAKRGPSTDALVADFTAELVAELARHAVTRDVSGLVGREHFLGVTEMRRFADAIGAHLREATLENVAAQADAPDSWRRGLRATFTVRRSPDA
jgi:hypothetical protein